MRVGFVGWRGMVGSVLLQRMQEERDFDHVDPVFFSTSRAGGAGPPIGTADVPLRDANDPKAFAGLDAIVTCQGGDWTHAMHPALRAAGWSGHWIDAASALRMNDDAVIILDPLNRGVIDEARARGAKDWIGGNCTVSLMMMAFAGLLERDLVEWMTCMTYQAASGAGAQNMRELLAQMGEAHLAAKALLESPGASILDIDREVAGILRDERFPTEHFGVPLAGSLIPWIDKDLGNGMSREEWKGSAELNKILGRGVVPPEHAARASPQGGPRPPGAAKPPIPVESICVRIGAMRCHSQAVTIKLTEDLPQAEIESLIAGANEWVRLVPNTRDASIRHLTPAAVTGKLEIAVGRVRKLALGPGYVGAFTVGDQLLWGAAEPLRRMLRILVGR
ncbi:aspartate-semialdehyde dehydrogenase [Burkholderiales bacterium]|nr:aspartate-semialdehyde dehydrogenase [Burkholderiales bacterium]